MRRIEGGPAINVWYTGSLEAHEIQHVLYCFGNQVSDMDPSFQK